MTRRVRRLMFMLAAAALAWTFLLAYRPLPPLGRIQSKYGDLVNSLVVPERHVTDAVTAVNFDIRGFDTLGEEFILFTSVMGTLVLMRRQKDEPAGDHQDQASARAVPPATDAIRVTGLALIPVTVLFGLYMIAHGAVTPGGGFQGGVILASAPLLLYLCAEYSQFRRAMPRKLIAAAEAIGAAVYILIGGMGIAAGGLFLQNTLPLGPSGSLTGGGIIPLINLGVGCEVSGGLALVLLVYLEELIQEKEE